MNRVENWESVLAAWTERNRQRPFAWGSWDCILMAADAVRAITGEDLADGIRGTYKSEHEAARILLAKGWRNPADAVSGKLGPPMANTLMVQRGDVVLMAGDRGPTIGVCLGEHSAVPGLDGIAFMRTLEAVEAWRV